MPAGTRAHRWSRTAPGALAWLGACACASAPLAPLGDPEPPVLDRVRASPLLALDTPVRGSTADPAPHFGAVCTGGGTEGTQIARGYRFVAPITATYRFTLRADYAAILAIKLTRDGPQAYSELACSQRGRSDLRVTLQGGETYAAIIDGRVQAPGTFELAVTIDDSAEARIRAEDTEIARALIAAAPRLAPGRTLGSFASVAGGLRAGCGGLGSGTVYALALAAPSRLALHAAAHFPVALEVRERGGAAVGCARAEAGRFDVALAREVPAGAYVVILDVTELSRDLFDARFGSPAKVAVPGSGVSGHFALDTEVAP